VFEGNEGLNMIWLSLQAKKKGTANEKKKLKENEYMARMEKVI